MGESDLARRIVRRSGVGMPQLLHKEESNGQEIGLYLAATQDQIDGIFKEVIHSWQPEDGLTFIILAKNQGVYTAKHLVEFRHNDVLQSQGRSVSSVYNLKGEYPEWMRTIMADRVMTKIMEFEEDVWGGYMHALNVLGMFERFVEMVRQGKIPDDAIEQLPFGGARELAKAGEVKWEAIKVSNGWLDEKGAHLIFTGWDDPDLLKCFKDEKNAETALTYETWDWAYSDHRPGLDDILNYDSIKDEHAETIKPMLRGLVVDIDGDEQQLTDEVLAGMRTKDVEDLLKELEDDGGAEQVVDAIISAYVSAQESALMDEYFKVYKDAFEDKIGATGEWVQRGKDKQGHDNHVLVFSVSHSQLDDWLKSYEEANYEVYDGDDLIELFTLHLNNEDGEISVHTDNIYGSVDEQVFHDHLSDNLHELEPSDGFPR